MSEQTNKYINNRIDIRQYGSCMYAAVRRARRLQWRQGSEASEVTGSEVTSYEVTAARRLQLPGSGWWKRCPNASATAQ